MNRSPSRNRTFRSVFRPLIVTLFVATLTACAGMGFSDNAPPPPYAKLDKPAKFYLDKDATETYPGLLDWRFSALQALLEEGNLQHASALIDSLQKEQLSPSQQAVLLLFIADKQYLKGQFETSQKTLAKVDSKILEKDALNHYLIRYAELSVKFEDHLNATNTLLILIPRLDDEIKIQQYNDVILDQLSKLPADTLTPKEIVANEDSRMAKAPGNAIAHKNIAKIDPDYKTGWYALGLIYQKYQHRPNKLKRAAKKWQEEYSDHAANDFMPSQIANLSEFSPYQPDNIAVLLPLSGRFKAVGSAIEYGFINARFMRQKDITFHGNVPILHFYDTKTMSMEEINVELEAQHIDFIVGPLIKQNIAALEKLETGIPTLALNGISENLADDEISDATNSMLYSFSVSPETEAQQAAQMIASQGHKDPIVIAPKSAYGKRVVAAFKTQWEYDHPGQRKNDVESFLFTNKSKFAGFIDKVMKIDDSKQRINQMQAIVDVKIESEARSRRDVDAIYIISKRSELILFKPYLGVATSPFAKAVPLYASSRSHDKDSNDKQRKELAPLIFSDNHFLLNADNNVSKDTKKLWARQPYKTQRYFAFGHDSYNLVGELMQLQHVEGSRYKGLMGTFSLNKENTIETKYSWAQYTFEGETIEVPAPNVKQPKPVEKTEK